MIRLFVSDIDGCLAEPYRPYRLRHLQELATLAARAAHDETVPRLSLCSGRAYSYVEAMAQALGVTTPVLFEAGGGLFDPVAAQVRWNPSFTPDLAARLRAVQAWMEESLAPGTSLMVDYGKRTQVGVAGPDEAVVMDALPKVEAFVDKHAPELRVFHTPISIDVLAPSITKREAMSWLAGEVGCALDEIAFIGDSNGDLGALGVVGYPFAPANAAPEVQRAPIRVTEGHVIDGVLEAYRWCIARNVGRHARAS